jgi:hypothetical protein
MNARLEAADSPGGLVTAYLAAHQNQDMDAMGKLFRAPTGRRADADEQRIIAGALGKEISRIEILSAVDVHVSSTDSQHVRTIDWLRVEFAPSLGAGGVRSRHSMTTPIIHLNDKYFLDGS